MKKDQIIHGKQLSRKDMKKLNGGGAAPPPKTRYYCNCAGIPAGYMCTNESVGTFCVPTCCTAVGTCSSSLNGCWNS
jgi:hypothetical protein